MAIPVFLAADSGQLSRLRQPLPRCAFLSCRFSQEGLQNLPAVLPPGSLLILDDSVPFPDTDPQAVCSQLKQAAASLDCSGLLLDFEHPVPPALGALAQMLSRELPCPVAVSEACAAFTRGPVFLSLLLPHQALRDRIAPWEGRELWMELGPGWEAITLTREGAQIQSLASPPPALPFRDSALLCRYAIRCEQDRAIFTLMRSAEDLRELLQQAESLGISRCAALLQDRPFLP